MSIQPINVTGLEVIEHLDFDHEPPCEYSIHRGDQAAMFVVRVLGHCKPSGQRLICLGCWEMVGSAPNLRCNSCDTLLGPRDANWTIVRVIGSAS